MVGSFFDKVYHGLLGLSLLFMTSYTGNDARIGKFSYYVSEQNIIVNCQIENAFENDFEEIFLSGIDIPICFETKLTSKKLKIAKEEFEYHIRWISKNEHWEVTLENQDYTFYTNDYDFLIEEISKIKIKFDVDLSEFQELDFELKASLPKLYIPSIKKEVDLMLLWKLKSPTLTKKIAFTGV
ncbi:MAG: hypothetical protein PHY08_00625 [Candidatus Cloacimonetes bacterium]|jgi:hypothetical protein|nr:hypothetical protein [Candidatus Cloacimonadota bacterium]MDD4155058.1 hypothetical protein [Candidatus Cloacimonadota bacterium]